MSGVSNISQKPQGFPGALKDKFSKVKNWTTGKITEQIDKRPLLMTIVLVVGGILLLTVGVLMFLGTIKAFAMFSPFFLIAGGVGLAGFGLVIGATHLMGKNKRFAKGLEIVRAVAIPILFLGSMALMLHGGPAAYLFYPALICGAGGFVYVTYQSLNTLRRRYYEHKRSRFDRQKKRNIENENTHRSRTSSSKKTVQIDNTIQDVNSLRRKRKDV